MAKKKAYTSRPLLSIESNNKAKPTKPAKPAKPAKGKDASLIPSYGLTFGNTDTT